MTMKAKTLSITLPALDADGICAAQTTAGAGSLLLNGALISGGAWTSSLAHQIGVYSAGNIATVVFTITGTDQNGKAVTETVTGVNAGTVETVGFFKAITSITVDSAVGTNATVGTVDEICTQDIPLDVYTASHTFAVNITGTLNYDMEVTFARVNRGETAVWANDADVVNETTSQYKTTSDKYTAVRIVVNSYTAGATIDFRINPEA